MRNNTFFNPHTLDIFKAALPHVTPQAQGGVNLILKANELMETVQEISDPAELSAMALDSEQVNPEQLLLSIKEVCTPSENEMVDMMLNFMKARKIYSAYQDYGSQVLHTEEMNANRGRNPFGMPNGQGPNGVMDMLLNFLSPEQRNTLEMVNMMMSTMAPNMFHSGEAETASAGQV